MVHRREREREKDVSRNILVEIIEAAYFCILEANEQSIKSIDGRIKRTNALKSSNDAMQFVLANMDQSILGPILRSLQPTQFVDVQKRRSGRDEVREHGVWMVARWVVDVGGLGGGGRGEREPAGELDARGREVLAVDRVHRFSSSLPKMLARPSKYSRRLHRGFLLAFLGLPSNHQTAGGCTVQYQVRLTVC